MITPAAERSEAAAGPGNDRIGTLLDRVVQISDAIESSIGAGDWVEASALDLERRERLVELFEAAGGGARAGAALGPGARAVLTDLLARIGQAIDQVQVNRHLLAEEATQLGGASRALRAYEAHLRPWVQGGRR